MEAVQEAIKRHLENVKGEIIEQMEANKRNASGRSVGSLNVTVDGNRGILEGAMSFAAMEKGRQGGKVPYGFTGIIKQWILDKGIAVTPIPSDSPRATLTPEERGLNTLAGCIAHRIAKDGTRLHRDGGFNDIYSSAIDAEMDAMSAELLEYVATNAVEIHQEAFNFNTDTI